MRPLFGQSARIPDLESPNTFSIRPLSPDFRSWKSECTLYSAKARGFPNLKVRMSPLFVHWARIPELESANATSIRPKRVDPWSWKCECALYSAKATRFPRPFVRIYALSVHRAQVPSLACSNAHSIWPHFLFPCLYGASPEIIYVCVFKHRWTLLRASFSCFITDSSII